MSVPTHRRSKWTGTLRIAIPVAVSAALVYWVAQDVEDPELVWQSILGGNWALIAAVVPLGLSSHFLRALRWRCFIGKQVPVLYAFSSVMIGYAVNGVIPRGGEFVRVINMRRMTGIPVAHLLATLVVERLIDLLTLVALIGMSVAIFGGGIGGEFPLLAKTAVFGLVAVAVGLAVVGLLAFFPEGLRRVAGALFSRFSERARSRVEEFVDQATEGLSSLRQPRRLVEALLETVGIWILLYCAYLVALAAYGLFAEVGLLGSAVTYSVTNASVLVPAAGAIGAFHRFGLDSLTLLYAADPARSLACVTVIHLIGYYVVPVGGGSLMWIGQSWLRRNEVHK